MIKTAQQAAALTDSVTLETRKKEAIHLFDLLMKAIELRAKAGYRGIELDFMPNEHLVKLLTDAGFTVEIKKAGMEPMSSWYMVGSVSWWKKLKS